MSISAFIICCNEEKRIARCIESVLWCDEIVIVDSGSSDNTLTICRSYDKVRVLHHPWEGYIAQKRFALSQCNSEWVLNIDADEEVSSALRDEILAFIQSAGPSIAGAEILRVVWYLNEWWNKGGWHPEYRLRLLRRTAASWGGVEPHERASVEGSTHRLKGELFHYTYENMSDHIATINRFSTLSSLSQHRDNKRCSLISLTVKPVARFFKFFILRRGYRHGRKGFIVAVLESFQVFLKYAKLWELASDSHHRNMRKGSEARRS